MAGLGYDGSIRIDTHINSDGFSKGLSKMAVALERQIKQSERILDGLTQKRKKAQDALYSSEQNMNDFYTRQSGLEQRLEDIRSQIKKSQDTIAEYTPLVEKGFQKFEQFINAEKQKISDLEPELEEVTEKIAKSSKEFDQIYYRYTQPF